MRQFSSKIQIIAESLLEKNAGKLLFDGEIVLTDGTQYGVNWNYGDKVRVEYGGLQFDCRVLGYTLNVQAKENGMVSDTITAYVRGEENV